MKINVNLSTIIQIKIFILINIITETKFRSYSLLFRVPRIFIKYNIKLITSKVNFIYK